MNKSTAAQRSYIASLAAGLTNQQFADAFKVAARINQNIYRPSDTPTQAAGRLTCQAASILIDELKKRTA